MFTYVSDGLMIFMAATERQVILSLSKRMLKIAALNTVFGTDTSYRSFYTGYFTEMRIVGWRFSAL